MLARLAVGLGPILVGEQNCTVGAYADPGMVKWPARHTFLSDLRSGQNVSEHLNAATNFERWRASDVFQSDIDRCLDPPLAENEIAVGLGPDFNPRPISGKPSEFCNFRRSLGCFDRPIHVAS